MESNWKEIAISSQKYKNSNYKEDIFENEIIACLKLLGWRETNGSIQRQKDIPIGNNNSIRIDILLKKNESTFLHKDIINNVDIQMFIKLETSFDGCELLPMAMTKQRRLRRLQFY